MTDLRRYPDVPSVAAAAGELFIAQAKAAIAERGIFHGVLSGGSTPRAVHAWLAERAEDVDWAHVHLWFGDERTVPADHAGSNVGMAYETLIDRLPGARPHVHPMRGDLPPSEAADHYEAELRAVFGDEMPRFDLVFLGLGDDAHTASLFPHTQALSEASRWAVANFVPKLDTWRITLTVPVINRARTVAFLVTGAGKAQALHSVLHGEHDPDRYPAQLIRPDGGMVWLVDVAAAGETDASA
ncbi:MAG: 6-phosphogluconolactonase [Anaerolineae bacterium]|jgi:6-phosphogluconolactonase|nr:6-phosphogluconolactonase [Anaerolineae bacterium]